LSILHFSGKFKFYPPIYNNEPRNPERYFNATLEPQTVLTKITDGVDPLKYFEFEFLNVYVTKVTYDDGSLSLKKKEDPIIGKKVILKGLLVDVSPHLERGRLFAGEIRIIDFIMGKLELAVQSDLFKTIRNDTDKGVKILSADFDSKIYNHNYLENTFLTTSNSRYLRELQINNFGIYFNVRKFSFQSLEGEINGYFGPYISKENSERIRLSGRRLLFNPEIESQLIKDFHLKDPDNMSSDIFQYDSEDVFRYDLELVYDIIEEKRMIVLKYLHAIPFIDQNDKIPTDYRFFIVLLYKGKRIKNHHESELELKLKPKDIFVSGGIHTVKIPLNIQEFDKLKIEIVVTKDNNNNFFTYLKEPQYDLSLINYEKFLILKSNEKREIKIKIFEENRNSNKEINLEVGQYDNDRSPTVAHWTDKINTKNGIATGYIQARNLENSEEIEDPTPGIDPDTNNIRVKLNGDLPWDRYYGNYVYIKINNQKDKKPLIKYNIPVRVLHSINLEEAQREIDSLNKERIQEVVTKMLRYYTRYYPWLHVEYRYRPTSSNIPKLVYNQFLKVTEYLNFIEEEDISHWHIIENTITKINHFLDRLEKDDHDWSKMPRSRDFPFNGVEYLKMWKTSIIDKMIKEIEEQRNNMKDENLDKINFGNWEGIQELINKIDNLNMRISEQDKKLILTWKVQLLEEMVKILTYAKTSTRHFHSH
jgi:hypothetical protein